MEDASLQFNLGSIGGRFGELKFSFIVSNNGNPIYKSGLMIQAI